MGLLSASFLAEHLLERSTTTRRHLSQNSRSSARSTRQKVPVSHSGGFASWRPAQCALCTRQHHYATVTPPLDSHCRSRCRRKPISSSDDLSRPDAILQAPGRRKHGTRNFNQYVHVRQRRVVYRRGRGRRRRHHVQSKGRVRRAARIIARARRAGEEFY